MAFGVTMGRDIFFDILLELLSRNNSSNKNNNLHKFREYETLEFVDFMFMYLFIFYCRD